MYATIRRYEGVDKARTDELTRKVGESLLPRLSETEGFRGFYLIEAGDGVMSSITYFDTSAHADESTRVVAEWLREEKLESLVPNAPKITGGEVIVTVPGATPRASRISSSVGCGCSARR
jgi:hypothetical protein